MTSVRQSYSILYAPSCPANTVSFGCNVRNWSIVFTYIANIIRVYWIYSVSTAYCSQKSCTNSIWIERRSSHHDDHTNLLTRLPNPSLAAEFLRTISTSVPTPELRALHQQTKAQSNVSVRSNSALVATPSTDTYLSILSSR